MTHEREKQAWIEREKASMMPLPRWVEWTLTLVAGALIAALVVGWIVTEA